MGFLDKIVDPIEKAFWQGAAQGQLLLRHCNACQQPHWYPRPICPLCGHRETRFKPAAGHGTIYSLTRLRAKDAAPQCLAYITLDEGVTLLSQVIETDGAPAQIGQRVALTFQPGRDGRQLPVFHPAAQPEDKIHD